MIQKPLKQKTPLKRTAIKKPTYEEALAKAKAKQAKTREIQVEGYTRKIKAKPKKPTVSSVKKKCDMYFSTYIRLRDGTYRNGIWWCQCITCDRWIPLKEIQAGHFQSRRYNNTRFHEENVNAQCKKCNIFGAGEQYKYSLAVDRKYGPGTAEKLTRLAQEFKSFKLWELEEMIETYKAHIAQYEKEMYNDASK